VGASACIPCGVAYSLATYSKWNTICHNVNYGRYDADEGFARGWVGSFPVPKGPSGWIAKQAVKPIIKDVFHKSPGRCFP